MVEDQGPPSGRAGEEAGKAPFLLPYQPPQTQGVPRSTRGENMESCPGTWESQQEAQGW